MRRSVALLDERMFFAEPMGRADDTGDTVRTASARLTAETAWGVEAAARFALDGASHVLGGVAAAALPDGSTLGDVVAEARVILDRTSPDGEQRLGPLAPSTTPPGRRSRRAPRRFSPRSRRSDASPCRATSARAKRCSASIPPARRGWGPRSSRRRGARSPSGQNTARPTSRRGPPPVTRPPAPGSQRATSGPGRQELRARLPGRPARTDPAGPHLTVRRLAQPPVVGAVGAATPLPPPRPSDAAIPGTGGSSEAAAGATSPTGAAPNAARYGVTWSHSA